MVVFIIYQINC